MKLKKAALAYKNQRTGVGNTKKKNSLVLQVNQMINMESWKDAEKVSLAKHTFNSLQTSGSEYQVSSTTTSGVRVFLVY